jgi:hypothetical protein
MRERWATAWNGIAQAFPHVRLANKGGTDESFNDHAGDGLGVVEHVRYGAEWQQFL